MCIRDSDTAVEIKNIQNLDYSFMVCDTCTTVFCKICEVYHEAGKATCNNSKKINSETIVKVTYIMFKKKER